MEHLALSITSCNYISFNIEEEKSNSSGKLSLMPEPSSFLKTRH